ncbi:hypothetical protein KXV85_006594 [Aspergillus fumigatus]|nr:hypothetical protein KXV28_003684 [Aspergillus fumigatus]KAH2749032.1 hypothetical protein KXW10_006328 [Aspergillus fumigatus]KAH2832874.1 hypothetical protein KXV85_006594 [Aspergillus fumigatus]KAH2856891.1 hypothetical protein KXV67_003796 [Aspergillus fumigatus]
MTNMNSLKAVFCFAVCYLATLSSGVGLIEGLKVVDDDLKVRNSSVEEVVVPLALKYLARADTVTLTVTETVCDFSSTTLSKPSTTIWIPPIPSMVTTASMPTSQTSVSTSESSTTSSVEQTASRRTSSTSSSDASAPVPSSSEPPFAPPLSDSATGQGKIHFASLVWTLVMTSFMNV